MVAQICEYTETSDLYTLKGWKIVWRVNYISLKLLLKQQQKPFTSTRLLCKEAREAMSVFKEGREADHPGAAWKRGLINGRFLNSILHVFIM